MKIITQKGVWVSDSFTKIFGSEDVIPSKTIPGFETLNRSMSEKQIKDELGAQECTVEDVAAFLENPPQETNDGYANLFYVAGFVVHVHWSAGRREWRVRAWGFDGRHWDAGRRVFSRNWPSETVHQTTTDTATTSEEHLSAQSLETLEDAIQLVKQAGYQVSKIV